MIFMFVYLHFIRQFCFTWQTVGYRKSVHFDLFWPFLTFLWRHRSKYKVNIIVSCRVRRDISNAVWIFTLRLLLLKIRRGGGSSSGRVTRETSSGRGLNMTPCVKFEPQVTTGQVTRSGQSQKWLSDFNPAFAGVLRHPRLVGGGGGVKRPPRHNSRTNGRRETNDAAFESSRWDDPKAPPKFSKWGHVSGQGQVKSQNRGFQVTSHRDLKVISFGQKLTSSTPEI